MLEKQKRQEEDLQRIQAKTQRKIGKTKKTKLNAHYNSNNDSM